MFWKCKKGTDFIYHHATFGGLGHCMPPGGRKVRFSVLRAFEWQSLWTPVRHQRVGIRKRSCTSTNIGGENIVAPFSRHGVVYVSITLLNDKVCERHFATVVLPRSTLSLTRGYATTEWRSWKYGKIRDFSHLKDDTLNRSRWNLARKRKSTVACQLWPGLV